MNDRAISDNCFMATAGFGCIHRTGTSVPRLTCLWAGRSAPDLVCASLALTHEASFLRPVLLAHTYSTLLRM
ncbi:MAG: hypothetical protein GY809_04275 [Planctomycetes bacterium]|nr:hypothetical protein [Planctomycetota bacterium]